MDEKKKLIALISSAVCESELEGKPGSCIYRKFGRCGEVDRLDYCAVQHLADNLLDNGVTVQRWIPVAERLPDHNKSVLVYCENYTIQGGSTVHIGSCDTMCNTPFWFLRTQPGVSSYPNHEWRVTHWMPIPSAPTKEE